jgi:hypothetical protein
VDEVNEIFCDKAKAILREALESELELRRDVASSFVLSGKGAMRSGTRPSGPALSIEQPPCQIVLKWLDDDDRVPSDVSKGTPTFNRCKTG